MQRRIPCLNCRKLAHVKAYSLADSDKVWVFCRSCGESAIATLTASGVVDYVVTDRGSRPADPVVESLDLFAPVSA